MLHVDMNSSYASVDQAERPELRGRPVAEQVNRTGTAVTVHKRNKPFVMITPASTAPLAFNDETARAVEGLAGAPVYRDAGGLFEDPGI